jgi:glycosyltransferase involved in cell wall biosynthesis
MRIIYLHQYFNTPAMPGGTRSYEMARRLVSYGHEVHMVTSVRDKTRRKPSWQTTNESGIHVHWLPVPYSNKMSYAKRIMAFFRFAFFASRKAASLKGDLVYATSTPLTIAIPAVYASIQQKIPMVFEIRDLWPELPIAVGALKNPLLIQWARYLEKWAYDHSKRIVALSPGMKEGIAKVGYPECSIAVIPNGCDLDLFFVSNDQCDVFRQSYDWLGKRPLVVYCGTLGLINGVEYFVRLAKEMIKIAPEIRFLVVGEGREETKIRGLAKNLGVFNKNFFMFSRVAKKDISVVVKSAQIATSFVVDLKEMWNNSANKFFDALAAGTPVAINYQGWQAEILVTSEAGLVLDTQNISKAAQDLLSVLSDEAWLKTASRKARELAEKEFSRDLLAKKLESILLEAFVRHKN